jgi:DNA-directed RNA polymerase specialized sigma24 family protein
MQLVQSAALLDSKVSAANSVEPGPLQPDTPQSRAVRSFGRTDGRATLERWVRARTTPQRVVLRSRIVLLLIEGLSAREVARRIGVSRHTVDLWRERYLSEGCDSLLRDRPGRGRKRSS